MHDCLHCITPLGCQGWPCMSAGRPEVQCTVQLLALPVLHVTDVGQCQHLPLPGLVSLARAACSLSLALQQNSVHSSGAS